MMVLIFLLHKIGDIFAQLNKDHELKYNGTSFLSRACTPLRVQSDCGPLSAEHRGFYPRSLSSPVVNIISLYFGLFKDP
jgi:hypothetical protein